MASSFQQVHSAEGSELLGDLLDISPLRRSSTAPAAFDPRLSRAKVERAIGKLAVACRRRVGHDVAQEAEAWPLHEQSSSSKGPDEVALIRAEVRQQPVCALLAEADVDKIVDTMRYFTFRAGQTLVKRGNIGHYFFIVHTGLLEVLDENGVVTSLRRGNGFGDSALLFDRGQKRTVVAKEDCGVWGLDGTTFRKVLMADEEKRHAENYVLLDSIKLFDSLSAQQKARVGQLALMTRVYEPGSCIIREGEEHTAMCFVKTGTLGVIVGASIDADLGVTGGNRVEELRTGDLFGKSAVLHASPKAMASIVADSRSELVCVGIEQLKEVLGDNLAAALETSLILKIMEKSVFISQFSIGQKREFAKVMEIRDYEPGQSVEDDRFELVAVLRGDLRKSLRPDAVFLERAQLGESREFQSSGCMGFVKRRSSRSLVALSQSPLASVDDFCDLVAGPDGARIATLTQENLSKALREIGLACTTDETLQSARKALMSKKVPIFHHLSSDQIDSIAQSFMLVRLRKSTAVCEQGSLATDFWVVAEGEVEELIDDRQRRIIGKHGHFGIRALLVNKPRTSTMRIWSTEAELWQLEGETFDQIVVGNTRTELLRRMRLQDTPVELKDLRHVRVIGEGGFGSVRMVEHLRGSLRYALKRVRKQPGKVMELVERECALLRDLDHPLILLMVKTMGTADSMYILSELLTGGDLLRALDSFGRPLSRPEAQFYAGSLVLVLDFLHDRHIVFRDLKPENVMLDARGYVKLIDFGTAKKLGEAGGRTFTMIGSYQFMAPEVTRGRGYGTEVDLWSLGVMLFEFVCGYLPFGHGLVDPTGLQICRAVLTGNLVFSARYSDTAGKHLIRGMLRKEPERRLGGGIDGYQCIREHEFFATEGPLNLFDMILGRQFVAPLIPELELYADAGSADDADDEGALSDADELGG